MWPKRSPKWSRFFEVFCSSFGVVLKIICNVLKNRVLRYGVLPKIMAHYWVCLLALVGVWGIECDLSVELDLDIGRLEYNSISI